MTARDAAVKMSLKAPLFSLLFLLLQSVAATFCTHLIKTTSERPRLSEARVSGMLRVRGSARISALNMNYCRNAAGDAIGTDAQMAG